MADKLDEALGLKTEVPVSTAKTMGNMRLFLPVVLILILGGGIFWVYRWFSSSEKSVSTSSVKQLSVEFSQMTKPLAHGDLQGKIEGADFDGRTMTFCETSAGEVIMKSGTYYIRCSKADVKQVSVTNEGDFSIRLMPGTYFVNSQLEGREQSADLPGRVSVRAGQTGVFVIHIHE